MPVALHPEGVDRNAPVTAAQTNILVALHPEGVDRNKQRKVLVLGKLLSPSTRRAWIEILLSLCFL